MVPVKCITFIYGYMFAPDGNAKIKCKKYRRHFKLTVLIIC